MARGGFFLERHEFCDFKLYILVHIIWLILSVIILKLRDCSISNVGRLPGTNEGRIEISLEAASSV